MRHAGVEEAHEPGPLGGGNCDADRWASEGKALEHANTRGKVAYISRDGTVALEVATAPEVCEMDAA